MVSTIPIYLGAMMERYGFSNKFGLNFDQVWSKKCLGISYYIISTCVGKGQKSELGLAIFVL